MRPTRTRLARGAVCRARAGHERGASAVGDSVAVGENVLKALIAEGPVAWAEERPARYVADGGEG